ncbi:hypothetical protein BH925_05060 [Rodentibacter pneumotropicus]|uniref:hypothetical protein n=1 Tax=Rodentibacter pneumotropicus TaxID=758 RepID=UPI0009894F37|nr:hypothetical protein [Rodentibacter pneumotropicus]OOF65199.1 hypothetical protein BH925_05060 [Rodentibacter pneumotropicus]
MSELLQNTKVRMTIEVEMDEYQREQLEISANTEVLGGKIVQLDWEGGVFDEVEAFRSLFDHVDGNLMSILFEEQDKDEHFINEIQLAIARVVKPIIKSKRKQILEDENE